MTRKEFVVQITEQIKENPKAILRGHGLAGKILNTVATRDDLIAKLVNVAYSTVYAKKGPKSLLKKDNFRIFGYKDFADFNRRGRADIEVFQEGLSEKDAMEFDANENTVVILCLPDSGDTGSTEENIATGKSTLLKFESSVRKEYKIAGGIYLVVALGDSAIRSAEKTQIVAQEKRNEKIVAKTQSPAKIKAKLVKKAKEKQAKLKRANARLKSAANINAAQVAEIQSYARQLGLSPDASPAQIMAAQRAFNKRTAAGSAALKTARADVHQREINTLRMKKRTLNAKYREAATAREKANIAFALRKIDDRIDGLKAKMGILENLDANTIKGKIKSLAQLNSEIEANIRQGLEIEEATEAAIAGLNIPEETKEVLTEMVVAEIDGGASVEEATAEAIQVASQELPSPQVQQVAVTSPKRRGGRRKKSVEEILQAPVGQVIPDLVGDGYQQAVAAPSFGDKVPLQALLSGL